jgi:hypothetical protein
MVLRPAAHALYGGSNSSSNRSSSSSSNRTSAGADGGDGTSSSGERRQWTAAWRQWTAAWSFEVRRCGGSGSMHGQWTDAAWVAVGRCEEYGYECCCAGDA